jgi:transcription-repair coupling factor (superfamily II helicase)
MSDSTKKSVVSSQSFVDQCTYSGSQPVRWGRLYGCSRSLALLEMARSYNGPLLIIAENARQAKLIEGELKFFAAEESDLPIMVFPDWESLAYDNFSPHQDIISKRLQTLYRLPNFNKGIVIAPVSTLMHRLAPAAYVSGHTFFLEKGQELDLEGFRNQLSHSGYTAVSQVMMPGEFAVRGGLIDLFPMGSRQPYRLDLFGDELDSIRLFDPSTQRSGEQLDSIRMLPAREYPTSEEGIKQFRQRFRSNFEGDPQKVSLYVDVSNGLMPSGIEYYLPLYFEHMATIFDYLPEQSLVVVAESSYHAARDFHTEVAERYAERKIFRERPILEPERLFLGADSFFSEVSKWPRIALLDFQANESETNALPGFNHASLTRFDSLPPPQLQVDHHADSPYQLLFDFIKQTSKRILIVAEAAGRRETLKALFNANKIDTKIFDHWHDFYIDDCGVGLTTGEIEKGLLLSDPDIAVITETQLYGARAAQKRRRSETAREPDVIIRNLAELKVGDPVVHEDHGIGRYLGLQTMDVGDGMTEFLTLEYAGGDKLYIPVVSLHLISRYTGTDPETTPLHKLGGEAWEKAKRRAQKKAHDAAVELLEVHAKRSARQGHQFKIDEASYGRFAELFPFEETPDQDKAIDDVISDMSNSSPMDRLVCGDVGFGKTEVAMRATFLAVHGEKQVAILVPTTLLAQQHFQNFQDRFADEAVKIELLSRFRTKKEIAQAMANIASGKADIIIGTHRLLQPDIKFKNLGLVIIDEEHRFGVRHKEKLKMLRATVDILTLTATPIPRTLNMALSGMRDISIIATAPEERLSVKTFVYEDNNALIREAFLREIRRGGQVYFLHNEVRTIEKVKRDLAELVPEANICIAHGQMPERELEQVMLDFYHQRFNVLLCTTIIESGIDVPTANTIIIKRADKFGLSQLHQLRGRVGRSHHRAYAYLMIPSRKSITNDARKRLDAISALEDLGAGFALASNDLEIRGAGELLGEQQSGEINEIGFTLYSELLNRAIKTLKAGDQLEIDTHTHSGAEINIHAPTLLPDKYLPDVHMRLVLYKRIASANSQENLNLLQEEIVDRFGVLPEEGILLFKVTALKLLASSLGIRKIDINAKGARIIFENQPKVDPATIIHLIQTEHKKFKLEGPEKLRFIEEMPEIDERIRKTTEVLKLLQTS